MELRQMVTEREREVFGISLAKARATRGFGFRDVAGSQVGRAHLAFGDLFAVFEHQGDPLEQMKAGFACHDLATLPLSYPKPDVSHLPPKLVLEGGELWSLSSGAGRVARVIAAAVTGIKQAIAVVAYAPVEPGDVTHFYMEDGYVRVGEPVVWPYAETIEGGKIRVQPMILEGEKLQNYIRSGFDCLFRTSDGHRGLRFENPFPPSPRRELSAPGGEETKRVGGSNYSGEQPELNRRSL